MTASKREQALERFEHVLVLTHVPPFREACWHEGRISGDDYLPYFACKATGDVLLDEASGDYQVIRAEGFGDLTVPGLGRRSQLAAALAEGQAPSLDDSRVPGAFPREEIAFWRMSGVHYFVPCVAKTGTILELQIEYRNLDGR